MVGTVCFDLDGVIATGTKEDVYSEEAGWAYEKCDPILTMILTMRQLHKEEYKIIIHTARKQCDRDKTVLWLNKFSVPYDELVMDKPYADLYIDDHGYRFVRTDPLTISRIRSFVRNSSHGKDFK